jgi:hypothetical protein
VNFLELNGNSYQEDFPNLVRMLKDVAGNINVDNWEGQVITHQFSGTTNETISHKIGKIPTKVSPLLQKGAQATFEFVSATDDEVVLKASDALLELTFYLE